jgi:hypothetical protein
LMIDPLDLIGGLCDDLDKLGAPVSGFLVVHGRKSPLSR